MYFYNRSFKSLLNPTIIPIFGNIKDYILSNGLEYIDITQTYFNQTTKEDFDKAFYSYYIEPSLLRPLDADTVSYTDDYLLEYELDKRFELTPDYFFLDFNSIYLEQLHYLHDYLYGNFKRTTFLFFRDDVCYSLSDGSIVDISVVSDFHVISDLRIGKSHYQTFTSPNGLKFKVYTLHFYLDVSQFFDYLGIHEGNLPIIEYPRSFINKPEVLPLEYHFLMTNPNNYLAPFIIGHNNKIHNILSPRKYPFRFSSDICHFYFLKENSFTYEATIEQVPLDYYNEISNSQIHMDTVWYSDYKQNLVSPPRFRSGLIYNSYNPFEFYILFQTSVKEDWISYLNSKLGESNTNYCLRKATPVFQVYRFRTIDFIEDYARFSHALNFLPVPFVPILPPEGGNSSCCLAQCFGITN